MSEKILFECNATLIRPENIDLIEIAKPNMNNKHLLSLTFDVSD